MKECLFCKIVRDEIPASKVYENEDFVVFRDIDPKAKYHYLMIAKKHFATLAEMEPGDEVLLGRMLAAIPGLTETLHLEGGYRLIINQGENAGQSVPHLHIHILAGQKMAWTPA